MESKKVKRRQILEKKKVVEQLIKSASSLSDPLSPFPPFRQYNRNGESSTLSTINVHLGHFPFAFSTGLSALLESGCGDQLSSSVKQYIQILLKANMEGPYGSEWPAQEKIKRREMVSPEARYIFVHQSTHLVGFLHYRFTIEEDIPVLYVYELQLDPCVQAKGLGKFLMQLIELIARKNCMSAVMLTVQKANSSAINFYTSKLRYIISTISPSRVDPLSGVEKSYEILCKAFDDEAKAILEV